MSRTTLVLDLDAARTRVAGIGAVAVMLVTSLPAQVTWTRPAPAAPAGRSRHAMAFDFARGRMVLFGGRDGASFQETWEWDGTRWSLRTLGVQPPAGLEYGMAYDIVRGRCVLVGGYSSATVTAATWEFDGTAWVDRSLPGPSYRESPVVAYDEARGRVVLFGGYRNGAYFSDTWEWNGTAWIQHFPATRPMARAWHRMAYDPVRGRVVLFGGEWYPGGGTWFTEFADTWEWDGTNWSQLAAAGPPGRRSHALAFDALRGRMVLTGGEDRNTSTVFADTWEWQGGGWVLRTPAAPPPARTESVMAYDATLGRVLLFGGVGGGTPPLGDTWLWDGLSWVRSTSAGWPPAARAQHALAEDPVRQRIVLFGGLYGSRGLADTWEWDGSAWLDRTPVAAQRNSAYHAMAYDAARARVVRFGGFDPDGSLALGETSEWDGTQWLARVPTTSPSPRYGHAMAYDSARGRTVLFGGSWPMLADTWEWDGTSWVLRSGAPGPSARWAHAMAYDPVRRRAVLFGGLTTTLALADTWEWDGTNWLARAPASSPSARGFHGMTYDAARRRVVLFGGRDNGNTLRGDTWEWDGTDWSQRAPVNTPTPQAGLALAYDSARARVVFHNGAETWTYGPTTAAEAEAFGPPCAGSTGLPAHSALDLPWLGDAATLRTATLPAPAVGFLFLGFDRTQWNGVPLPLDLTALGMTGCALRVEVALARAAGDPGGALTWSVPVGNTSDLLGLTFFTQSLHVDTSANPFGATTSNGLRLRIGGR